MANALKSLSEKVLKSLQKEGLISVIADPRGVAQPPLQSTCIFWHGTLIYSDKKTLATDFLSESEVA
ncbi:hypothetical protein B1B04_14495 [Lysinibacillus sp. KCTC 33748]|nr:hypothetical protein B1B04_14495 [Lysinibacillus sp. KCTC 33748]